MPIYLNSSKKFNIIRTWFYYLENNTMYRKLKGKHNVKIISIYVYGYLFLNYKKI